MTETTIETIPTEIEAKRLNSLTEKFSEDLGKFDILPVGKAGFLIQSHRLRPMAGNDWLLFDYDDTLNATTIVKKDRLQQFKTHLKNSTKFDIPEAIAEKVMKLTNQFSRWQETQIAGKKYHANTHMSALSWATDQIKQSTPQALDQTINHIDSTLKRIKSQLENEQKPQSTDPFRFQNKKLILKQKHPWSKAIENIFEHTMITPPQYQETINAAKKSGQPVDSIHRTNIGIFTYGDPYYQLLKSFKLLRQHPDLPISQIWLTKVSKGDFIQQLVETKTVQKSKMDYVPPELEDSPGESPAYGSGYPLSQLPHVLVMFDDDPKQLNNILEANQYLEKNTGAAFVAVRSRRKDTKAEKRSWEVATQFGEIDFTSKSFSPKDITTIFQINTYLKLRDSLGTDHQRIIHLAKSLQKRGINTNNLKSDS